MNIEGISSSASSIHHIQSGAINRYLIGAMMFSIRCCIRIRYTSKAALTGIALNFTIGDGLNGYGLAL